MTDRSTSGWLAALPLLFLLGHAGVAGAASAPADDIRDIHGPIEMASPHLCWWAVGAGAAVVAAAATARVGRRRRRALPPDLRALQALARQRALAGGQPRAFAIAVSETVRAYLEEAFAIHAPRRTTEELLADLIRESRPAGHAAARLAAHQFELTEFLRQCDLAKFAGASLSAARMNAMLDSAEALVRATAAPAPDAAPIAGVA